MTTMPAAAVARNWLEVTGYEIVLDPHEPAEQASAVIASQVCSTTEPQTSSVIELQVSEMIESQPGSHPDEPLSSPDSNSAEGAPGGVSGEGTPSSGEASAEGEVLEGGDDGSVNLPRGLGHSAQAVTAVTVAAIAALTAIQIAAGVRRRGVGVSSMVSVSVGLPNFAH